MSISLEKTTVYVMTLQLSEAELSYLAALVQNSHYENENDEEILLRKKIFNKIKEHIA